MTGIELCVAAAPKCSRCSRGICAFHVTFSKVESIEAYLNVRRIGGSGGGGAHARYDRYFLNRNLSFGAE